MAEAAYNRPLQLEIEEQLRCPICQEQLRQPRELPCQHTFCRECLSQLEIPRKRNLLCPVCRKQVPLPEGGVDALPQARLAASLLDICKRTDPKDAQHEIESQCVGHGNKPLDFYCIDCQVFACRHCFNKTHRNHSREGIGSVAKKCKENIEEKLALAEEKSISLQHTLDALVHCDRQLDEQKSEAEFRINALADSLVTKVRESQRELLRNAQTATKMKRRIISMQKEEADRVHKVVKGCQESVKKSLQNSNDRKIITSEKQLTQQLETVISSSDLENLNQVESLEIAFQENEKLEKVPLHNLGSVVSDHVHKQCTASGKGLQVATVGEEASFEVIVGENCSPSTAIISCQLKPEDPQFAYQLDSNGAIVCSYVPTCLGPHTLSVGVGGQDIPNSPFSLTVLPLAKEPTKIFEELNCPSGIAVICQKSKLVVAEKGFDCITLVNIHQPMSRRKSFPLPRPHGIAISADKQILAISQSTSSLVKVNMEEEKAVKEVGGKGPAFWTRPLSFKKPTGIAVSQEGTVFVTEYDSHQVQVLHPDLTYSTHIGSSLWGPLRNPSDVALDSEGKLYVISQNYFKPKIVVLSRDGSVSKAFGKGILVRPSAIALSSNGTVFVADDYTHQIVIFDSKGEFLMKFGTEGNGKGEFNKPSGLAIDEDQVLYISDSGNNRIVTYKLQ